MDNLPLQQTFLQKEKYIAPLVQVLEESAPQKSPVQKNPESIRKSLDNIFPEQDYENKDIQKAKDILGLLAKQFTSQELYVVVTEIKFLASSWLDDYEREIFDGQTLKKLLHEKGSI